MLRASLLVVLLAAACGIDAPWAGPSLPSGARAIAYRVESEQGLAARSEPGVAAATSLAELRAELVKTIPTPDPCVRYAPDQDPCWQRLPDEPGRLYVAVPAAVVCYRTVKEAAGISGRTLYFIYWIGTVQRACNVAVAQPQPQWRLLSFARADLPASGTLTVDLQTQDDGQITDVSTEVDLG